MAYRPYIWRKNNPEKRQEQKRREKVRMALRKRGILPPSGEEMNEEQLLINEQIGNNDFSYWDSIKLRTSRSGGIDKQIKAIIQSPEYLLWYRVKWKCKENGMDFNLSVEDIVIPEICEITNQPISTDFSDNNNDNYYTLSLIDYSIGYVSGNVKVVSVLGILIEKGGRQLFQDNIQKQIYYRVKQSTKKRKLDFNLEPQDIIVPTHCPLLGVELLFDKVDSSSDNYYTVDRIDSSKGYIKGNVQVISRLANTMKNKSTEKELITFSQNILKMYDTQIS